MHTGTYVTILFQVRIYGVMFTSAGQHVDLTSDNPQLTSTPAKPPSGTSMI